LTLAGFFIFVQGEVHLVRPQLNLQDSQILFTSLDFTGFVT